MPILQSWIVKLLAIAALTLLTIVGLGQLPGTAQQKCDPSYPGVCIASPPPDLDCGDITHRNFSVTGDDPHHFDGDDDGIGCEA